MTNLEVQARLIPEKLQFIAEGRDNKPVQIALLPPDGDGDGYTPLEMVLVCLATCSGYTVNILLRGMHKDVAGLKVSAKGTLREEHPTIFQKILLEFAVTSKDATEADVQKAISRSEEKYCPVWAMLKPGVEIAAKFTIAKA